MRGDLAYENVVPGVDLGLLLPRRAPRRLILPICPSFAWLSSDKLPLAGGPRNILEWRLSQPYVSLLRIELS